MTLRLPALGDTMPVEVAELEREFREIVSLICRPEDLPFFAMDGEEVIAATRHLSGAENLTPQEAATVAFVHIAYGLAADRSLGVLRVADYVGAAADLSARWGVRQGVLDLIARA